MRTLWDLGGWPLGHRSEFNGLLGLESMFYLEREFELEDALDLDKVFDLDSLGTAFDIIQGIVLDGIQDDGAFKFSFCIYGDPAGRRDCL